MGDLMGHPEHKTLLRISLKNFEILLARAYFLEIDRLLFKL